MRDISTININDGGRPVNRDRPSESDIREFEQEFKVLLPLEYLEFLRLTNGGHPENGSFVPLGDKSDNRFSVDYFYHLMSNERQDSLSMWRAMKEWGGSIGDKCVPIGRDGGDNQLFLDLFDNGSVGLCIHDESFKRVMVAKSFSDFLDLLEEDPEMI